MKRVKEDMMVSSPRGPLAPPTLADLVVRELGKLRDMGSISNAAYEQGVDLAKRQSKVLNNIYRGSNRDLRPAVMFVLRQLR